MSPETADLVVTVALTAGLVLSGAAAIAALPWRRSELDAAHRAAVALGWGALRAVITESPAPTPPVVAARVELARAGR